MHKNSLINIKNLNGLYLLATKQQDEAEFLLAVYAYISEVYQNSNIAQSLEKRLITSREENGGREIKELKEQLCEDAVLRMDEFEKFFKDHGMEGSEAMQEVEFFRNLNNGKIKMMGDLQENLIDTVRVTLAKIPTTGPGKELIDKYTEYDKDGLPIFFNWSENLRPYGKKKNIYERLAPTNFWYWWDQLDYFYAVYKDYEDLHAKHYAQQDWWICAALTDAHKELQDVLNGNKRSNTDRLYYIHPQQMHAWLGKFHLELTHDLQTFVVENSAESEAPSALESQDTKKFYGLQLNILAGTIRYGNNATISISPGKQEIRFLDTLMKSTNIVAYKEMARILGLKCYREDNDITNADAAREVQHVRKYLHTYLVEEVGVPDKIFKKIIKTFPKVGIKYEPEL